MSYPQMESDNSYMMSDLIGSNSMMGLYGGGSDDFDLDLVTNDDFSYFDEVDRFTTPISTCLMICYDPFHSPD